MGMMYTRKCQKEFYKSKEAILWILHDLAYAAAHGNIDHDKLIRLGEKASGLVAKHGHLVQRKTTPHGIPVGLWPPPRDGFPKMKQRDEEVYDIEILYEDNPQANDIKRGIRCGELKTIYDEDGSGKIVRA